MQGNNKEQSNFIQLLRLHSKDFPFLIKWLEKRHTGMLVTTFRMKCYFIVYRKTDGLEVDCYVVILKRMLSDVLILVM